MSNPDGSTGASSTPAKPEWTLAGAAGALGLPALLLAAGIAFPRTLADTGERKSAANLVRKAAQENPAPMENAASQATLGTHPDVAALRGRLPQDDSPLDRLRVRRALSAVGAEHCQALMVELSKGPFNESPERKRDRMLRLETEERWIAADPRHAALSGWKQHNNFPERAIRYLAARDFPAARQLAQEVASLGGGRMGENPFAHDLLRGLASTDVQAAFAYAATLGNGWQSSALEHAADTQPEAVIRLLPEVPETDPRMSTRTKALEAIARENPRRALELFRSREFPKHAAADMERRILRAMMHSDRALAAREAVNFKSVSGTPVAALIAEYDVEAAFAHVREHPRDFQGLEETLILPDPAAALKRWQPDAPDPIEQRLWWRAAATRLFWLWRDLPPGGDGKAGAPTEAILAAAREIIVGVKRFADSAAEPHECFGHVLGHMQSLDPALESEMVALIPEKWGEAGGEIRTNWLERTGAAPDEIERDAIAAMPPDKVASGYFDLATARVQKRPETALTWALGQTGEAWLGALAGVVASSQGDPDAVKRALDELLATARPDHPQVAKAVSGWVVGNYHRQPDVIGGIMQALPRGPLYDAGALGLSRALLEDGEPAAALQWAATISDPLRRNVQLTQTVRRWCGVVQSGGLPAAVRAEILRLPIAETTRQRLLRTFER